MKCLYVVFLGALFCSCQETEVEIIKRNFEKNQITIPPQIEYCIILPSVGCGGCIDEGISFLQNNKEMVIRNNSKILLVFTAILSEKMLLRSLEEIDFKEYDYHIDKENIYRVESDKAIYPIIIYLTKGEIVEVEYQSPSSPNAFSKLGAKINKRTQ